MMDRFLTPRSMTLPQLIANYRRLTEEDKARIESCKTSFLIRTMRKLEEDGDIPARNADLLSTGRICFVLESAHGGACVGYYSIGHTRDQIRAFNLTDDLRGLAEIVKGQAIMDGIVANSLPFGPRPSPGNGLHPI